MTRLARIAMALILIVSSYAFVLSDVEEDIFDDNPPHLPSLETSALQPTAEHDFEYDVSYDKTVTITGFTGLQSDLMIPQTISGYPVTTIGDSAFRDCDSLVSVNIPDGVTTIGYCVFNGCNSLKSVVIPDSVNNLKSYLFDDNNSITYLSMPIDLDRYKVGNFNNLISLNLTKGHTGIGPSYHTGTGLWVPWSYSDLSYVMISEGVVRIGEYMFSKSTSLVDVSIPDSLTSIGHGAFYGCISLKSINIPDSVIEIGNSAFYKCTSLVNMEVGANNKNYASIDGILYNRDMSVLMNCPAGKIGIVNIPDSVVQVSDCAFHGCSSLTSISIGNNVSNIRDLAFSGCSSLTGISIPGSVNKIGNQAFYGCSSLKYIKFEGDAPLIGENLYSGTVKIYYGDTATGFDASVWDGMDAVRLTGSSLLPEEIKTTIAENDMPEIGIGEDIVDDEIDISVFEELSEKGKTLKINVSNDKGEVLYSWTFEGELKNSAEGTFKAGISELESNKDLNDAVLDVGAENPLMLSFAANGELPIDASVEYNVSGHYENGSELTLFFYNGITNKLEEKERNLVVENGWVAFNLTHCSTYVLAEMQYDTSVEVDNMSQIGIGITVAFILIISVTVLVIRLKRN